MEATGLTVSREREGHHEEREREGVTHDVCFPRKAAGNETGNGRNEQRGGHRNVDARASQTPSLTLYPRAVVSLLPGMFLPEIYVDCPSGHRFLCYVSLHYEF